MTQRCVIERWVQRKTDQKLIFNGNYTQIVFFVVFLFQDTLSLCFILFIWFIWSKNMCKHTLTHIIAKKSNFCLKKQRQTMILAIFGDFRVFDMTSLMTSLWRHTRYVCTFFGTNGLGRVIAIHQYQTLDVSSIGFRDLRGGGNPPQERVKSSPFLYVYLYFLWCLSTKRFLEILASIYGPGPYGPLGLYDPGPFIIPKEFLKSNMLQDHI